MNERYKELAERLAGEGAASDKFTLDELKELQGFIQYDLDSFKKNSSVRLHMNRVCVIANRVVW